MSTFNTAFSPGDKGWAFHGGVVKQLTIGLVRAELRQSTGITDEWQQFGGIKSYAGGMHGQVPDNYAPQNSYVEEYMCEETGIGSGSVYTLGQHIFLTEEECRAACAEHIAEQERQRREREEYDRKRHLESIEYHRLELERLTGQPV